MMADLDDDELAQRLFDAARVERPAARAKRRTHRAIQPRRSHRAAWWPLAAAALVAGVLMLPKSGPTPAADELRSEKLPTVELPPAAARSDAVREPAPLVPVPAPTTNSSGGLGKAPPPPATRERRPASLEEELDLLDRARQALLEGDPQAASSRLSEYDRVATRRQLGAEGSLLRMQILAASGRRREASELATRFVAQNPDSPLVDRARALIQPSSSTGQQRGVRQ